MQDVLREGWSTPTVLPVPLLPARTSTLSNTTNDSVDVSLEDRDKQGEIVKNKFIDILKVNRGCDRFPVDTDNFDDEVNVKGRLHLPASIQFFKEIGASEFILDILEKGHHPKLKEAVPDFDFKNNSSFFKHQKFAEDEILRLLSKGRIEIVNEKPKCVNPLSVVVQRTKSRLILDCSHLNKYIEIPHIKYEGHETALNFFKKGGFMFSFDLRDGYHHIKIRENFKTYLGFQLPINGVPTYFQYVVGCFGLADLPWLFTKIYRPLVKHWRSAGIPAIMFLDDGGFFESDLDTALAHSDHVRKDLIRSGSIYSIKKSNFLPSQKMTWLGFDWDSESGSFSAASHRVEKINGICNDLLGLNVCPVRKLSSFVGQIISLLPVVGNCARVTTKMSQFLIAGAPSWDSVITLTEAVRKEVLFWKENLDRFNIRHVGEISPPKVMHVIEGDASATGCGSWLNREKLAARIFSPEERECHSTFRELANVHFSILAFLPQIKNSSVKFLVDNQAAVAIIDHGSSKPELQFFAKEIFHLCYDNSIKLTVQWVPRENHTLADQASREADAVDIEDWGINENFFKILNESYGPFSLDAFANFYNKKVDRFYSLFHCPGSSGVDAFTYNWHGENLLLVPPVSAIGRVLSHLRLCKAKGTLVAPRWPSSYFWPLLQSEFNSFILDIKIFKGKNVLVHGLNKNSLLGAPYFNGDILAIAIDCSGI